MSRYKFPNASRQKTLLRQALIDCWTGRKGKKHHNIEEICKWGAEDLMTRSKETYQLMPVEDSDFNPSFIETMTDISNTQCRMFAKSGLRQHCEYGVGLMSERLMDEHERLKTGGVGLKGLGLRREDKEKRIKPLTARQKNDFSDLWLDTEVQRSLRKDAKVKAKGSSLLTWDEILSETYTDAMQNFRTYDPTKSFRKWVKEVQNRKFNRVLRDRKTQKRGGAKRPVNIDDVTERMSEHFNLPHSYERVERRNAINNVLRKMPSGQKKLLIMNIVQGLSPENMKKAVTHSSVKDIRAALPRAEETFRVLWYETSSDQTEEWFTSERHFDKKHRLTGIGDIPLSRAWRHSKCVRDTTMECYKRADKREWTDDPPYKGDFIRRCQDRLERRYCDKTLRKGQLPWRKARPMPSAWKISVEGYA